MSMFACGGGNKPSSADIDEVLAVDSAADDATAIPQEVINEFMNALPSPLETSVALKESGVGFNPEYLNDPKNVSNYNSSFSQAMNLGVYGADLGYANVYEQNQEALFYLDAVRDLANNLSISQFFKVATIRRLVTQSSNLDSLLLVTTKNFNDINEHLQSRKRSNLSILLLTGGWIEAVYITCQVSEANPTSQELMNRIAEQKVVCDNIKYLLSIFATDKNPYIKDLFAEIENLYAAFDKIEIETIYGEQEVIILDDGTAQIKDNTQQIIHVTREQVDEITQLVSSIRNDITG